jgi:hypothetical protein
MWAVKGRYNTALQDDEDVEWLMKDGQDILKILVVSSPISSFYSSQAKYYQQPDTSTGDPSREISLPLSVASGPPSSGTVTPDTRASLPAVARSQHSQTPADGSGTSLDPFKEGVMNKLGIPLHLAVRDEWGLRLCYEKWKAYLTASNTYTNMRTDGTWTGPPLTGKDIIEIFVSKSHFHSHFKKSFPKVSDHPDMVEWLNNEGDTTNPNYNRLVWGFDKATYTFIDLFKWLDDAGENNRKKGKGKGKGKDKKNKEEGGSKKKKDKDLNGKGKEGAKVKQVK